MLNMKRKTATESRASCFMLDIGNWDEETIALLLGRTLNSLHVEIVTVDTSSSDVKTAKRNAKLTFSSRSEMLEVLSAYGGLGVAMTHNYHYYSFSEVDDSCAERCNSESEQPSAGTPPLHLQLMALPTKELERRLKSRNCPSLTSDGANKVRKGGGNRRCRVHRHAYLAYHLCQALGGSRPARKYLGVPAPPESTEQVLLYLRTCALWPPREKQRKGVSAGNYLTVRKHHPPEHDEIWNLCRDLIQTTIPDTTYNALAITKFFRGSPHVDNHDQTFQHVIALGMFEGGELCAEANGDGTKTDEIDVRNRFGRIDGRGVHWVNAWSGERYSIVYYSTAKEDWTERLPQDIHTKWMRTMNTEVK